MKYIYIFLLSTFLMSCGNKKTDSTSSVAVVENNTAELNDEQLKSINLKLGKIEPKVISAILKLNGKIDVPPQNMISISIPLGGFLKSTRLLPGMHIKKGEVLATLEDQQYIEIQQDYLTTKVKLNLAEQDFQRQKELNKNKANSDKVFQQASSEYQMLKIQLKALSEKLSLINVNAAPLNENNISRSINILSPISGYVTRVNANIGKYINTNDVLFELVNPNDLHLALIVFEKDLDKLKIGQQLVAYNNDHPEKKYPCEILLIGKDFAEDRSLIVHCHFENELVNLTPGMFMNAEVEITSANANAISADAVVNFEGKDYIFIARDQHRFDMTEVIVGNTEHGFTEIKGAEKLINKNIVIHGAYSLLMSLKNKEE